MLDCTSDDSYKTASQNNAESAAVAVSRAYARGSRRWMHLDAFGMWFPLATR